MRDDLFNEHEQWRRHQALIAEAQAALDSIRAQQREENEERREMLRKFDEAVTEAAATGSKVPPDPPPPSAGLVKAHGLAMRHIDDLRSKSQQVVASIAADVERRAAEEHDKITEEVADAVDLLDDAAKRMTSLLKVVTDCRTAVESQGPRRTPSPSSQTRPNIQAAELVNAVRAGDNVLAPLPTLGMQRNRIMEDRGLDIGEAPRAMRRAVPDRGRQV